MRKILMIAATILSCPADAQEIGNKLDLICDGGGSAIKPSTAFAFGSNNRGGSANAIGIGQRSQGFDDQMQLWIEGNHGMARLPRVMLPKIHGGEDGWFEIKDIKVSPSEITGSVGVNFANHPKMVLDRLAGTVTLSGRSGQFNGRCSKFDPATAKRAF